MSAGVMLVSGFQSTVVEDLSDWSKNLDSKVFEIQIATNGIKHLIDIALTPIAKNVKFHTFVNVNILPESDA